MRTLKRRKDSGFVHYPKDFERRIIEGTARYRTKCDMLIGPCSCGGVHQEGDGWVQTMLADYDCTIEPLVLTPKNDRVRIPRYWLKSMENANCNMLIGPCSCGECHTFKEQWVKDMLSMHGTIIQGDCLLESNTPNRPRASIISRQDQPQRNEI